MLVPLFFSTLRENKANFVLAHKIREPAISIKIGENN